MFVPQTGIMPNTLQCCTQTKLCVTWLTFGQFSWVILKLTQIWNRVRHIRLTAPYMQQIESMYPHNIPAWVTSIESNDSQKFNSVSLHGQINDSPKWVFWLKIYYVWCMVAPGREKTISQNCKNPLSTVYSSKYVFIHWHRDISGIFSVHN